MDLLDPPTDPAVEPRRGAHRLVDDPAARPKRRFGFSPWWYALFAVVVLALVATVVILRDAAQPPTTPTGAPVVPPTSISVTTPPPADLPEGAFAGDGGPDDPLKVYVVGRHIRPGAYATAGALDAGRAGHWEVLSAPGEGDAPRRVRGRDVVGPAALTLEVGQILETRGLKPWVPAPDAEGESEG